MRKAFLLFGVLLIILLLAVSTVSSEPALILKFDIGAYFFDGNGNLVFIPSTDVIWVITNDDVGTQSIASTGTMPDGVFLPDKAVHYETGYFGYICTDTAPYFKYTLTPSGNYKMHCSSAPLED